MAASVTESREDATAKVGEGVLLDHRRAILHPGAGWMAVADLHYGYENHRSRRGAMLPDWGMESCEVTLGGLLDEHRPDRLILAGDIMDGAGSAEETLAMLGRLRERVGELVCLRGNHDRAALCRSIEFRAWHWEGAFLFHHGDRFEAVCAEQPESGERTIHVVGHEHPAVRLSDGAGLRLKLPALVRERMRGGDERWVLPAFSAWAAGGAYRSEAERLGTWVCAPGRVRQWQG